MTVLKSSSLRVKDPIAAELGRRGGMKGGKARAAALSPEQRREIAKVAAAARWMRLRDDHGPSMQADAGAALPGTARIARSGTILVGSSMLQWFDLEDERRLIGILSAAAALANISPVALERALEREFDPSPVVRLHQQSEWKLVSGVEIDSFVAHCSRLARSLWQGPAPRGQARVQAVAAAEMLLTFVGTGLAKRVDDSQAGLC